MNQAEHDGVAEKIETLQQRKNNTRPFTKGFKEMARNSVVMRVRD